MPSDPTTSALTHVLTRALRGLGEAGYPDDASRLAATGWAALRRTHPTEARQLNGLLHYLARLPERTEPATDEPKESTVTTEDKQLDVRAEIPARRHELIFATYAGLAPGEAFVLINDHDPKPLYYQFSAEHADAFSWEYLEQGPEAWRVRIGRTGGEPQTAQA
ncbi:DUF2249 domain-containing protein [Actinocatenispora comari]|uniref:DUF2249 domain-containing protein n=1 Tax=Actinocatenispora comari TaxID=2807577 RepID=A0A8J4ACH3_9ACTN|nr:DUF2249 domain-containing protein [Actinocatenispora comari]GIL27874.1 hypothetical protein NUM_31280 [Actinocatenispora comari]